MFDHKKIYDLKLHEEMKITGHGIDTSILRVPGGWIYNLLTREQNVADSDNAKWYSNVVFVPFSNEFVLGGISYEQNIVSSPSNSPEPGIEE